MLKEDGIILTRPVCTEFSRLPLFILGDEDVTFLRAQEDIFHVGSSSCFQEKKAKADNPSWT